MFDIYKFYTYLSEENIPIRLDAGEPDIPPHPAILEEIRLWIRELKYTPTPGIKELREKIAEIHHVDTREVAVVPGSKAGVAAVLSSLQKIGLIAPYWPGYLKIARTFEKRVFVVETSIEREWIPTREDLETIGSRVDVLVVNYPNNPTGAVISTSKAREIVDIAESNRLVLVSDEAYRDIVFDTEAVSFAELRVGDTISVYSFSKTFSIPGLRIGYVIGDSELVKRVVDFVASTYTSIPLFAQKAAIRALEVRREVVRQIRSIYRERLDFFEKHIDHRLYRYVKPRGGFYVFLESTKNIDSVDLVLRLAKRGVGVFPGAAFGERYRNFIRISLTKPIEALGRALKVISEVVENWM